MASTAVAALFPLLKCGPQLQERELILGATQFLLHLDEARE